MYIETRYQSDYEYIASNEIGCNVKVDMRPDDLKESLSPTELLLSALSGCVAVDIMIMLKKKRKTVTDFVIKANGDRKETHPRGYTRIHLEYILTSPDASQTDLEKTGKLALDKYCSVADSISAAITSSAKVIRPEETK